MLLIRIKQFISAVSSKITSQDINFINKYLDHNEQQLFWQMDTPTQKHCLNTAYTCLNLSQKYPGVNKEILIKAALLHDCGKKAGDVNTFHRVTIVLLNSLFPHLASFLRELSKKQENSTLLRAFYIQSIHDKRGAGFASNYGLDSRVVNLILMHHTYEKNSDPELKILQMADNLN